MKNKKQRKGGMSLTQKQDAYGYIFVIPLLIGLIALFLPSIIESFINSFFDVQLKFNNISRSFVGMKNFKDAFFLDTQYRQILLSTIKGMVLDTIIIAFFSFFVSSILNQKFKGRGLARTIFFLPVILSTGIIASADASIAKSLSSNMGDAIGSAFGSGMTSFFDLEEMLLSLNMSAGVAETIFYAVENTYKIVNRSGVQILIFLSALQSIPPSIFEASKIEGASKWEEFWKITVPMIAPMILVNIVYIIVDSFTNPSYGIMEYINTQGFSQNRMGYSSALSWIYFLVVLIELGLIFLAFRKSVDNEI